MGLIALAANFGLHLAAGSLGESGHFLTLISVLEIPSVPELSHERNSQDFGPF